MDCFPLFLHILTSQTKIILWLKVFLFIPFILFKGALKARALEWFAIPSSSGLCFVRMLHYDQSIVGGPGQTACSSIELHKPLCHDKAVIHDGHESEQTPRDSEGQGRLACCRLWGCQESNMTRRLNTNNKGCPQTKSSLRTHGARTTTGSCSVSPSLCPQADAPE